MQVKSSGNKRDGFNADGQGSKLKLTSCCSVDEIAYACTDRATMNKESCTPDENSPSVSSDCMVFCYVMPQLGGGYHLLSIPRVHVQ